MTSKSIDEQFQKAPTLISRSTSIAPPSASQQSRLTDLDALDSPEKPQCKTYQPIKRHSTGLTKVSKGSDDKSSNPMARWQLSDARDQPWNAITGIYTETRSGTGQKGNKAGTSNIFDMNKYSVAASRGCLRDK